MKLIILAGVVVLAITGCLPPPPHAGDPEYLPDGYVKRSYEYIYKTDGSQKAKECEFECKKQETQCKQLAATKDQTTRMQTSPQSMSYLYKALDNIKDYDDRQCEQDTIKCMKDVCNAPLLEKKYLN